MSTAITPPGALPPVQALVLADRSVTELEPVLRGRCPALLPVGGKLIIDFILEERDQCQYQYADMDKKGDYKPSSFIFLFCAFFFLKIIRHHNPYSLHP